MAARASSTVKQSMYITSSIDLFPAEKTTRQVIALTSFNPSSPGQLGNNCLNFIVLPEDDHTTVEATMKIAKIASCIFYIGARASYEVRKEAQSNNCKVYEISLGSSGKFSPVPAKGSQGSYIRIFCPNINLPENLTEKSLDKQHLIQLITHLAEGKITPDSSSHHHRFTGEGLILSPINKWT